MFDAIKGVGMFAVDTTCRLFHICFNVMYWIFTAPLRLLKLLLGVKDNKVCQDKETPTEQPVEEPVMESTTAEEVVEKTEERVEIFDIPEVEEPVVSEPTLTTPTDALDIVSIKDIADALGDEGNAAQAAMRLKISDVVEKYKTWLEFNESYETLVPNLERVEAEWDDDYYPTMFGLSKAYMDVHHSGELTKWQQMELFAWYCFDEIKASPVGLEFGESNRPYVTFLKVYISRIFTNTGACPGPSQSEAIYKLSPELIPTNAVTAIKVLLSYIRDKKFNPKFNHAYIAFMREVSKMGGWSSPNRYLF